MRPPSSGQRFSPCSHNSAIMQAGSMEMLLDCEIKCHVCHKQSADQRQRQPARTKPPGKEDKPREFDDEDEGKEGRNYRSSPFHNQFYIRKGDHQHHGIGWRWLKSQCQIEGLRLFGNCMNNYSPDADCVCRVQNPVGAILKQGAAQPPPVPGLIDRQPAKNGYRQRIGHIAAKPPNRLAGGNPA
jgi:hypothetical protein